jgi:hypothetical protein
MAATVTLAASCTTPGGTVRVMQIHRALRTATLPAKYCNERGNLFSPSPALGTKTSVFLHNFGIIRL